LIEKEKGKKELKKGMERKGDQKEKELNTIIKENKAHPFVWTKTCLPKFLYLTPSEGT